MTTRSEKPSARRHRANMAHLFNAAEKHLSIDAGTRLSRGTRMQCGLCAEHDPALGEPIVRQWPNDTPPTLGELIDTASTHFAAFHPDGR